MNGQPLAFALALALPAGTCLGPATAATSALESSGPGSAGRGAGRTQIAVVDVIPAGLSGETNQDSEPSLAVDSSQPLRMAASAFARGLGFCPFDLAPIFVSTDGGDGWILECLLPSDLTGLTADATLRIDGTTGSLFAAILDRGRPSSPLAHLPPLAVLAAESVAAAPPMARLAERDDIDQPFLEISASGRLYIGENDVALGPPGGDGKPATIDQMEAPGAMAAEGALPGPGGFRQSRIEARDTGGARQDGPAVRPAPGAGETVYAAFVGWRDFRGGVAVADVVVVRDDHGGRGPRPFSDLVDPGDGLPGRRVVEGRAVTFGCCLGQERLGSSLAIAADPRRAGTVYLAWADRAGKSDQVLHLRRSEDGGKSWSEDLKTVADALNPALAVAASGIVAFLYQQLEHAAGGDRWVTHLAGSGDRFSTAVDLVLATVPADRPVASYLPYLGDYVNVMAVGTTFYGIFSANNTPDPANFPHGARFLRNADWTRKVLLDVDRKTRVDISIDPFFFRVEERAFTN